MIEMTLYVYPTTCQNNISQTHIYMVEVFQIQNDSQVSMKECEFAITQKVIQLIAWVLFGAVREIN